MPRRRPVATTTGIMCARHQPGRTEHQATRAHQLQYTNTPAQPADFCDRYLRQASELAAQRFAAEPEHKDEHFYQVILSSFMYQLDFGRLGGRCTHRGNPDLVGLQQFTCSHVNNVQGVDGYHKRIYDDNCPKRLAACGPVQRNVLTTIGERDSWDFQCIINNPLLYPSVVDYSIGLGQLVSIVSCYELRCLEH